VDDWIPAIGCWIGLMLGQYVHQGVRHRCSVDAGRDPDHDEVAGTEAFGGMVAAVVTPQGSGMARQCFVKATYIVAAPA
jgi:hypothetical protein